MKGTTDSVRTEGKNEILCYSINDQNSAFLKKYRYPLYYAEYHLKQGKLVKFRFGFEYP